MNKKYVSSNKYVSTLPINTYNEPPKEINLNAKP